MSTAEQYEALAKLLRPSSRGPTEDPEQRSSCVEPNTRSDVVERISVAQPSGRGTTVTKPVSIWEDTEVLHQVTFEQTEDSRETPSFDFVYKQAVESTDAFLGMMNKDSSSACCEDLQLRIELPEAKSLAELDLDVQPTRVLLTAPTYLLALPLPHKIDEKHSSAEWDPKKKQLILAMRIVRDW